MPRRAREGQRALMIYVTDEMHDRLKAAAGERGMSDWARQAIQESLDAGGASHRDPAVSDLVQKINRAALALAADWQTNQAFYAALAGAISEMIDSKRSEAEPGEELVPIAPGRKPISIERGIERALTLAELWDVL